MPFADGTRIGRYVIQSLLGSGGMGEVYLAHDPKLDRLVALKILPGDTPTHSSAASRFAKEARAACALNHPNVAHIYEVEESDGVNFIALEFVPGETLRARLRRGRVGLRETLDVALQVSSALSAAHERGIVHRDVKPENIMVAGDGHVKLLDFGLVKMKEAVPYDAGHNNSTVSQVYSQPGVPIGTVSYMSPEQARGAEVDARTDVWSLGVVLYEIIAGRPPFEGASGSDIIAAILNQPPLPLTRFSLEVTEAVEWVVMKALAKDRAERYETAREMHTDLRRLKRRLDAEESGDRPLSSNGGGGVVSSPRPPAARQQTSAGGLIADPTHPTARGMSSAEYIVSRLQQHRKVSLGVLSLFALTAVAAAYLWTQSRAGTRAAPPHHPILSRVTYERGLQGSPTWSPDGRLIAFSSDQDGDFDIWVKSVGGGDPQRITESKEHDWQPDWSPDGELIVFRSERDGGGLYVMHAPFGKPVRKISSFGYSPKWSPDGQSILFLRQGMRLYERPRAYVTDRDGASPPREVLVSPVGDERGVRQGALAWHPDSRRVSYWGEDRAFYTVPVDGGTPVQSEVAENVARQIQEAGITWGMFQWGPSGDVLYLEGRSRGVLNLWRVGVDPATLKWVSGPERMTTSDGQDTEIAISRDGRRLAFTKKSQGTSLWAIPFNAGDGQVRAEGQAITPKEVEAWFPDIAPDGKKIVYSVYRQGRTKHEIWERSLLDGKERRITEIEGAIPFNPRWAPDSTHIAYSRHAFYQTPQGKKRGGSVVLLNAETGAERPLASNPRAGDVPWRDYIYDWSHDGGAVVVSSDRGSPERWYIAMLPVSGAPNAEAQMRQVRAEPDANLWAPRLSPDRRWVCYLKQDPNETASSVLYVVPASGDGEPARITDKGAWVDKPRWSPDGRTLYFISNLNSYFLNVYGVRFDPVLGRAVGEPFRVTNLTSPAKMVAPSLSLLEISLNKNLLVLPVAEATGNIWMLEGVSP